MAVTSSKLDKATAQIDAVLSSLDVIAQNKSGDLRAPYKKFSDEVSKTEATAQAAHEQADAMKAKAQEQFDAWANESQNINDPNLKKANLERRDQARAAFAKVQDASQKAKQAWDPFIGGLRDIRTFLGTDLTSHGVDAVSSAIAKVRTDGQTLKNSIGQVQKAITDVKAQLVSPTTK
jgi:chromosome segregation ATPase